MQAEGLLESNSPFLLTRKKDCFSLAEWPLFAIFEIVRVNVREW